MADPKINGVMQNGARVVAIIQARHELAKIERVETDELNENDIRIVAGDQASRWERPKLRDELIKEWNDAHPEK